MKPHRTQVLALAAKACVDPRTAAKALREGPDAVRGITGERVAEAMRELGIASQTEAR
jgi:DNA-binding LacI/PurR family transcriptional regulator